MSELVCVLGARTVSNWFPVLGSVPRAPVIGAVGAIRTEWREVEGVERTSYARPWSQVTENVGGRCWLPQF